MEQYTSIKDISKSFLISDSLTVILRFSSLRLFLRICPITLLNSVGGLLLGYSQVTHTHTITTGVVKMKVFPNKDDSLPSSLRVKL